MVKQTGWQSAGSLRPRARMAGICRGFLWCDLHWTKVQYGRGGNGRGAKASWCLPSWQRGRIRTDCRCVVQPSGPRVWPNLSGLLRLGNA